MALTEQAHLLIAGHFSSGVFGSGNRPLNLAIDATCGNGHDTLFLAQLGFKKVIGFDIQERAITATRLRLTRSGIKDVQLFQSGHEKLDLHVSGAIDCAIFNLGYLPLADKSITTSRATSLAALHSTLDKLAVDGLVSILCYPGHPAGAEETAAIRQHLSSLDQNWKVDTHQSISANASTPVLFMVRRLAINNNHGLH